MTPSSRTLAGGLAALLTSAVLTSVAPAHAAPAFTEAEVQMSTTASLWDGTCTKSTTDPTDLPSVPLVENGPAVASSVSIDSAFTANADSTDKITGKASISARSALQSTAGQPRSVSTSFTGAVALTTDKPVSSCRVHTEAQVRVPFSFTTTRPMWATAAIDRKGPLYVEAYLYEDDADPFLEDYGYGLAGSTTTTVFLPPGEYSGYLEGAAQLTSATSKGGPVSGKIAIDLTPAGALQAAPAGAGKPYVALPGARSCATHDATARLTNSRKRLNQLRSVTVSVNGTKVSTLRGRKLTAGRAIAVPIADARAATITATATLKSGAKKSVSARYLACAG
jgi:hypothetical protein